MGFGRDYIPWPNFDAKSIRTRESGSVTNMTVKEVVIVPFSETRSGAGDFNSMVMPGCGASVGSIVGIEVGCGVGTAVGGTLGSDVGIGIGADDGIKVAFACIRHRPPNDFSTHSQLASPTHSDSVK